MNREAVYFLFLLPAKEIVGRLFHRCYYNLHRVVFCLGLFYSYSFFTMGMGLFLYWSIAN